MKLDHEGINKLRVRFAEHSDFDEFYRVVYSSWGHSDIHKPNVRTEWDYLWEHDHFHRTVVLELDENTLGRKRNPIIAIAWIIFLQEEFIKTCLIPDVPPHVIYRLARQAELRHKSQTGMLNLNEMQNLNCPKAGGVSAFIAYWGWDRTNMVL